MTASLNAGINKIDYIDKIDNEFDDLLNVNLNSPFKIRKN